MTGAEEDYLIWSNQHRAWWGPDRCGYVTSISDAGRYTRSVAVDICTRSIPGDAYRESMLTELPVRLEDIQLMLYLYHKDFPHAPVEEWE